MAFRRSSPRSWIVGVGIVCAVAACDTADGSSSAVSVAPVLVDAVDRADGTLPAELRGRLEATPPNSDARRVLVLAEGVPALGIEPGERVLDAKILAEAVVVLGADHVLRHHTREGVRVLDENVHAPISVAAGRVAYVTGGIPDLTLRWVDLRGGEPESIAPGISPVWSPALSADGAEVIFAATVDGRPQLLHREAGGDIHEVAWSGRVPSSPVAPRWQGRHLIFSDEAGVVVLDLEQGRAQADYVRARLLPDHRSGASWVEIDGAVERLDLPEVAP